MFFHVRMIDNGAKCLGGTQTAWRPGRLCITAEAATAEASSDLLVMAFFLLLLQGSEASRMRGIYKMAI